MVNLKTRLLAATIHDSFDTLETLLAEHYTVQKPQSPQKPSGNNPDEYRKFADALDAYHLALKSYEQTVDEYNKLRSNVYSLWFSKLKSEYAPHFSDELFNVVYDKADDRGHSAGYSEVRSYLQDYVGFAETILRLADEVISEEQGVRQ